jgi:hypothetical protein
VKWKADLLQWQQKLISRLEHDLDRELVSGDLDCIAWNADGEAMTVESQPLLQELRSRNLISNVFRTRKPGR